MDENVYSISITFITTSEYSVSEATDDVNINIVVPLTALAFAFTLAQMHPLLMWLRAHSMLRYSRVDDMSI
jgi:hypothetical protein